MEGRPDVMHEQAHMRRAGGIRERMVAIEGAQPEDQRSGDLVRPKKAKRD